MSISRMEYFLGIRGLLLLYNLYPEAWKPVEAIILWLASTLLLISDLALLTLGFGL